MVTPTLLAENRNIRDRFAVIRIDWRISFFGVIERKMPMSNSEKCEGCGKPLMARSSVSLGSIDKGYRDLCMACYNATIAEYSGVDFEHADFEPIRLTDVDGVEHEFKFNLRLLGDKVALDAFEMKRSESGYEFQIIDEDPEGEPLALFGKLLQKMQRALAQKHIHEREDGVVRITDADTVRGRIECDLENEAFSRKPLLIVDGREIGWDEFGHMLMGFEGWNFKLEIYDKSEER